MAGEEQQVYAIIAFVLVMTLAYLDIRISATVILALEGVSMLLVVTACGIVLAKGGFHGHAFSSASFRPGGVSLCARPRDRLVVLDLLRV